MSLLKWFKIEEVTQPELLELSIAGALGNMEKLHSHMALLLIVVGKIIKREIAYGLTAVWACPYQAHLSSLDEVARKLTLFINVTNNWAYAFVWLNKDAQCIPLSNKGHISTIVDGVPHRSACGHLHQLEVHRLLQYGDEVMYPEGINRGFELVLTSLSGTLDQGMDMPGGPAH